MATVIVKRPARTFTIRRGSKVIQLSTIQVRGASGLEDRTGFVRVVDILPINPGDSVSNKVFEDAASTLIQSATSSSVDVRLVVECSYPKVNAEGSTFELPLVGSIYRGNIDLALAGSGDVVVESLDPDNEAGAKDTVAIEVDLPPVLLTLSFSGGYPGSQTELKAGDTFQISGTTDKEADAIEVQDFGASDSVQLLTFPAGTSFNVTMTIGDRGDVVQSLPARALARSSTTGGFGPARDSNQDGGTTDGVDLVQLNNLRPTLSFGSVSYPLSQQALKGSEQATVIVTTANLDSVSYDSPNAELSITNPTLDEGVKTVERIAGGYNVATNNLRGEAVRAANDAHTIDEAVVNIANLAADVSVLTPAARLRSGGNDGTVAQDHTITIAANQQLLTAPSLDPGTGAAGTFQGTGFAGGPENWTRALRVHDDDDKGSKTWQNLSATNLAGIETTAITSGGSYELGGFVARTLTFAAFSDNTPMAVKVADFGKLTAGIFTATNQPALKQAIGTPAPVTNGFTIDAVGVSPTSVIWLDTPAVNSNSGGTAQITDVEEGI